MEKTGTNDSYLICGTPRTGSTLLCSLLNSTGVAGHPESYFRQPDELMRAHRWGIAADSDGSFSYAAFVRAAIAAGSTENGVFGAKVMWGTLDEMLAKLGVVHPELVGRDLELLTVVLGRVRFCHLQRRDTVAQAVSWARAEATGYWHEGDTAARNPSFDFDRIDHLVRTIDEHNSAWRTWFAAFDIRPHVVSYEQLVADRAGVARGVLEFLGLDSARSPVTSEHRHQGDSLSADWIARYRAIAGG